MKTKIELTKEEREQLTAKINEEIARRGGVSARELQRISADLVQSMFPEKMKIPQ